MRMDTTTDTIRDPRESELVHFRDFALSSSNQLSTTINLSGALAANGRIIRKRRSSEDTAYCARIVDGLKLLRIAQVCHCRLTL